MTHDELERLIEHSLKRLPTPHAPESLLPKVMESVHRRARPPWYRRGWRGWPLAWQAGGLAAFVAFVAAGVEVIPAVQQSLSVAYSPVAEATVGPLVTVARSVAAVAGAVAPLWRDLVQPVWGYMFVVSLVLSASCAAIGAVLNRMTFGGAAQS